MEACLLKGNPANAWLVWARVKLTDAGELCHPKSGLQKQGLYMWE